MEYQVGQELQFDLLADRVKKEKSKQEEQHPGNDLTSPHSVLSSSLPPRRGVLGAWDKGWASLPRCVMIPKVLRREHSTKNLCQNPHSGPCTG
jgi:hypothetical protein